jgi:RNA polymerase sigma-70 factor (ECF subfamily)
MVRDGALAEDVAQDAFVRAFERIGSFDADRPFGPWFMKLVLNESIAAARRRGRFASREVRGAEEILARLADLAAGPHGLAEAGEVRRRVWQSLEELPPIQRAAIVERYYLGLSEAEMSERGASPPGTIKRRLHDARRGLSNSCARSPGPRKPVRSPKVRRRWGRNPHPERRRPWLTGASGTWRGSCASAPRPGCRARLPRGPRSGNV